MLRAISAGIQGWRGKPRRLPAEETLQFEKKNSSHPHRGFLCPAATARAAGSSHRHGSLQAAFCRNVRIFCGGVLIFHQDVSASFLTCLFLWSPAAPRLSHSRPGVAGHLEDFFMKQPFCAPSEALRRVLDAAAALPRPETACLRRAEDTMAVPGLKKAIGTASSHRSPPDGALAKSLFMEH